MDLRGTLLDVKIDIVKFLMLDQGLFNKEQFYNYNPSEADILRFFPQHISLPVKQDK